MYTTLSIYKQIITIFGYCSFGDVFLFQPFMSHGMRKDSASQIVLRITLQSFHPVVFLFAIIYFIWKFDSKNTCTKTKHTIYLWVFHQLSPLPVNPYIRRAKYRELNNCHALLILWSDYPYKCIVRLRLRHWLTIDISTSIVALTTRYEYLRR